MLPLLLWHPATPEAIIMSAKDHNTDNNSHPMAEARLNSFSSIERLRQVEPRQRNDSALMPLPPADPSSGSVGQWQRVPTQHGAGPALFQ